MSYRYVTILLSALMGRKTQGVMRHIASRLRDCTLAALLFSQATLSQVNRVRYNNQDLFLSGANLAWVNFARDVGTGTIDSTRFADVMLAMHDHGGNVLRWWLHTNGTATPQFNDAGLVIGPGNGAIADIRLILDIAWQREIGVNLCLWSFDMLRATNPIPNPSVLNRNRLLLTDTNYTRAYINNSLIPMVNALKGHPAIIAWEIFNEPEGMSNEFGWSDIQHVPMSVIQRFINLCSGAIHRTDPGARVTSGAWSFYALTDLPMGAPGKIAPEFMKLTLAEKRDMEIRFAEKYRMSLTADEIMLHMQMASLASYNYYLGSRLIAAGGDPDGTLDFYSVHYYDWGGTAISPFHHPAVQWGLDKPLVVGEFAMKNTFGVLKESLFDTLYRTGYAGALPWSWTDVNLSTPADMLAGMQFLWDNHRTDVDINGIAGDWPTVTITSPGNDSVFANGTQIVIRAAASDADGSVVLVEFFSNDTLKIGERTTPPYTTTWTNVPTGNYQLTAVATDNQGHKRTSSTIQIKVGTPPPFYALQQNYPNPFNSSTVIGYQVPVTSLVSLNVFDVLGREVAALVNQVLPAGLHTTRWDASALASGVYFYRIDATSSAQSFSGIRRMLLLK